VLPIGYSILLSKLLMRNMVKDSAQADPTWAIWGYGDTPKLEWNRGGSHKHKTCNL